jgi:hypothetical protein
MSVARTPAGDEPVTSMPLGMESRTAVQTATQVYHGEVYVKAGFAVAGALAGGTAVHVVRQLVDVMSIGTDLPVGNVDELVEIAKERAPDAQPFLDILVPRTPADFYAFIAALIAVLTFLGVTPADENQAPAPADITIQITNLHETIINLHGGYSQLPEGQTDADRPSPPTPLGPD